MLKHKPNKTSLAVGLAGLGNTMRSLAGVASALVLAGAIGIGLGHGAQAAVITSQMGIPAATGSFALGDTLTGGFISSDWSWSHTGYGVITDTILSVTLEIDLVDAEAPNRRLDLYVGTNTSGTFIGSGYGQNDGTPGPWLGLGDSSDNSLVISSDLYADIADGTFDIYGDNIGMWIWGSNRALLTITTEDVVIASPEVVDTPEPATLAVFGLGLVGLGFARRRRAA